MGVKKTLLSKNPYVEMESRLRDEEWTTRLKGVAVGDF